MGFYAIVFIAYVTFMIFGVLNVLIGLFCDAAIQATETDRENMLADRLAQEATVKETLTEAFCKADADGSGQITNQEFLGMLQEDKVRVSLEHLGVSTSEAEGLFTLLDHDDSGTISVSEFVTGCTRVTGGPKSVDLVTLLHENKKMYSKLQEVLGTVDGIKHALHFGAPVTIV